MDVMGTLNRGDNGNFAVLVTETAGLLEPKNC